MKYYHFLQDRRKGYVVSLVNFYWNVNDQQPPSLTIG